MSDVSTANRIYAENLTYGSGSPEGVITAVVGGIYMDTANGDIYSKCSGAGNTGWKKKDAGGINRTAVTVTPFAVLATHQVLGVTVAGAVTINLPALATFGAERLLTIKDERGTASTANITVTPNGAETIEGAASWDIVSDYGSLQLYWSGTGTAWFKFR